MRTIIGLLVAVATMISIEANQVILAPSDKSGKPIAVVWIHGMQCKAEAYKTLAQEFQKVAASQGYSAWVGIPEFAFNVPEPILIDNYVKGVLKDLKDKEGYPGSKYYLAAHSLGGVMSQIYAKGKSDQISGLILTGSVLLRNTRSIQKDGTTKFDFDVPTLTLNGELDGLLRVSKSAETYWHQFINIDKSQAGMFPLLSLQGLSHASFMDMSMLPSAVSTGDINPETDEKTGHNIIANAMINFIKPLEGEQADAGLAGTFEAFTEDLMKPLLEAMTLEGSYQMRPPCYDTTLVNRDSPECTQGNSWSEKAQVIMGGNLADKNVAINPQDNFHRVYTTTPVHLPQINNSCPSNEDATCTLESITVTENYYSRLDQFDTGKFEIGAIEMKAKLMSRQSVQVKAGDKDADFHQTDEVGNRCGEINKEALNWALGKANSRATGRYNKYGKKLVIGDDLGPYNVGPLWIWTYLEYKDNADKTQTTLSAPMMRTPTDYSIAAAAGFHYCKLLSPFRALEWIYHDSQLDHNTIAKREMTFQDSVIEAAFLQ